MLELVTLFKLPLKLILAWILSVAELLQLLLLEPHAIPLVSGIFCSKTDIILPISSSLIDLKLVFLKALAGTLSSGYVKLKEPKAKKTKRR